MSTSIIPGLDAVARSSLAFLSDILTGYPRANIAVRTWDGATWQGNNAPVCTLVMNHPTAVRRMFSPPRMLSLCEAYLYGDIDIEGDIEAFWALIEYLFVQGLEPGRLHRRRVEQELADIPREGPARTSRAAPRMTGELASLERDRRAIASHYDVSNEFYALWLDDEMIYSCAYFTEVDQSLEQAQRQKLDHICRKLRLRPGERLLDIGCGWGGLIRHACQHYGVEAVGITISDAQAELARERIRRAGLESRCRVELCDYREMRSAEPFDKIVSVGMFEHVTEAMLAPYFSQAWTLLRPGGVFLNHAIAMHIGPIQPVGTPFVYLYIFPDSQLQPISASLRAAESTGFEVRDVECLREHYELTTRAWLRRLESRADDARRMTSELTYRIYRLYLAMSAHAFHIGQPTIYQSLLSRPSAGQAGLPLTRDDWYGTRPRLHRPNSAAA
ncbi:MAG: cyclopropane-fatty-acyl-phospholipid synthase family protein [Gemmataceae bacterium]